MPVHDGSRSDQDERLSPPGPERSQRNPEQLVHGSQSTARSLGVQSQQLLMKSQVFKDEVLPGTESADQPTEEMSERHDTEWPDPIAGAQPSKNCACKFPRTQLKHCKRLFQGDAASIRKDVGGEPCRGTRDGAGRGLLHSWNHLSHEGRNSACASP